MMILFRTLLNRKLWLNPLWNVFGSWTLHNERGELTTECIENVLLFLPFAFLLLRTIYDGRMREVQVYDKIMTVVGNNS